METTIVYNRGCVGIMEENRDYYYNPELCLWCIPVKMHLDL